MRSIGSHHTVAGPQCGPAVVSALLLASRNVGGGLESLEAGRTIAKKHRLDRRACVRSRAVPLLVQLAQPSVEFHAFDDVLDLVAVLDVFQTKRICKVAAAEILVADLDRLVL